MFRRLAQSVSDSIFSAISPSVSGSLGTGKAVWSASDKMARLFPDQIRTSGEITQGDVEEMKSKATKMTEQAVLWSEYAGAVGEYADAYAGVVEGKAGVGIAMASARTRIVGAEKDLGISIIDSELAIRETNQEMAHAQARLSMPDLLNQAIYGSNGSHRKVLSSTPSALDAGLAGKYRQASAQQEYIPGVF